MTDSSQPTLLVTGASGHLGRSAVELLLETWSGRLIAATRSPEKLAALRERGVDVRRADFDEPATLPAAFAGADRVLLVSTDALDVPNRRLTQHRNAIRAAENAGVKHVVYTSSVAPCPTPESSLINDHYWTEHTLGTTGLDWTILRNNLYTDYLLMSLPHALSTGQMYTATGNGARNYVTRDDCTRSAVGALVSASGRGIHDISGPAPLTQDELAAIVSELTGRPLSPRRRSGRRATRRLARHRAAAPHGRCAGGFRRGGRRGLPCRPDIERRNAQRPGAHFGARIPDGESRRLVAERLINGPGRHVKRSRPPDRIPHQGRFHHGTKPEVRRGLQCGKRTRWRG